MRVSGPLQSVIATAVPVAGLVMAIEAYYFLVAHVYSYSRTPNTSFPDGKNSQGPHVDRNLSVQRQGKMQCLAAIGLTRYLGCHIRISLFDDKRQRH